MNAWLSVIGVGEEGLAGLSNASRTLAETAEVLVGGERHLNMVPEFTGTRLPWRTPLANTIEDIRSHRGKRVCVLATGDPMWFGIGVTLGRHFSADEINIVPAQSAFSLAAARLGWPLDGTETITLHGRPLCNLSLHLYPDARWLILSQDRKTPAAVAEWLCDRGFGESRMTVLEHMGGGRERVRTTSAGEFNLQEIADLNTIAVACVAGDNADWSARIGGLPDDVFVHDGQLTKREIRAATLAALRPYPGALLWDIGAGCGSIAIEWMRAAIGARAVTVEPNAERLSMIAQNAEKLGVADLGILSGTAPEALDVAMKTPPDAVFIGGGLSRNGLFETAWDTLKPGGRLVANVVTLEGEAKLIELRQRHGGELTRIAVSRAVPVGDFHGWKPLMPVTQWSLSKVGGPGA